jgi:hypothetical protein
VKNAKKSQNNSPYQDYFQQDFYAVRTGFSRRKTGILVRNIK